ncbi:hypothetical protein QJS10_CPA01g02332 [Acorus calamus]|uniref:Katanin p80 WD40 repeat-containing subunit B1 homolog n=1 Tax=Acorus calamus TaxID=4465 RepID=A0AAV9FIC0_ACOCL|nr:hypothetical protein QJS10_CPA01g02332 [Acorus calamus]
MELQNCLSGHTSPVKSVTYDSEEVLVVAGASSGTIKLWDLEESKIVRTLTGHRANCSSVEFHPFGEFFASGSTDTDLKIWDIRKKTCIHTYEGHSQGITTIRFTPDGRWVVSCGEDNIVKVWDLTAGRLLHEFKSHEGVVRCIDFHPHEFLMATGSADRTVKFWDLETFEQIGSSVPEASGVRSITFHPDGKTLFCGFEESLKVFSWEPIRCHDAVDMASKSNPSIRVDSVHRVASPSSVGSQVSKATEDGPKNGRGVGPNFSLEDLSLRSSKFHRSRSLTQKDRLINERARNNRQPISRPVAVPVVVPRDRLEPGNAFSHKDEPSSAKSVTHVTRLPKPANVQKLSPADGGTARQMVGTKSELLSSSANVFDAGLHANYLSRSMVNNETAELSEDNHGSVESSLSSKQPSPVKYVKGVAVVLGRTRSLVESWERRERCKSSEAVSINSVDNLISVSGDLSPTVQGLDQTSKRNGTADNEHGIKILMEKHDAVLNVLKSRVTKLQVSKCEMQVQVDLISVLLEKIDTITLDVFNCLLPLLRGLLDSNTERHISISLEMLLKLVKIFGPVISSTTSASLSVGVDLQAERRRDLCSQCFAQLQKIKQNLQSLISTEIILPIKSMRCEESRQTFYLLFQKTFLMCDIDRSRYGRILTYRVGCGDKIN